MRTEEWQEKAAFIDMLRGLTLRLNRYRAAYAAHTPLVSDESMIFCSVTYRRWKAGWD